MVEVLVPDDFKYLYEFNSERPVVKIPNEVLRKKANEIGKVTKKTALLVDDLFRIMRKANGVGLAAPQIGVSLRVVVIAPEGIKPIALINPQLVETNGEFTGQEGCLSIPGLYGDVTRPAEVVVKGLDRKGRPIQHELDGLAAKAIQHEIDHLDGVLFIDKVDPATLHWAYPDGEEPAE